MKLCEPENIKKFEEVGKEIAKKIVDFYEEHTSGARPSTKAKHEKGQSRRARDFGGEKGDKARRYPNKRPEKWRGPWPPKE